VAVPGFTVGCCMDMRLGKATPHSFSWDLNLFATGIIAGEVLLPGLGTLRKL